ncbi:hypothetical protein ACFL2H_11705 [Planctomycetota bacterium]
MAQTLPRGKKRDQDYGLQRWGQPYDPTMPYFGAIDPKNLYRQAVELSGSQQCFGNINRVVVHEKNEYESSLNDSMHSWEIAQATHIDVFVRAFTRFVAGASDAVLERLASEISQEVSTEKMQVLISTIAPAVEYSGDDSFVSHAQRLANKGQIDAALDIVYDRVDEMMLAGQFDEVNQTIADLNVDELSIDIILGVLTITLPGKSKLPDRNKFFEDAKRSLESRGEHCEGLLAGLN